MAGDWLSATAFAPALRDALATADRLLGPAGHGWVVGGTVRDLLLGRPSRDLDLVVPSGALDLGRALADRLGWSFFALDERRGVCRAVGEGQVDVADFRAPTLTADLEARDFSVNALAVSVRALIERGGATVEDPTGGRADLAARRVRLCGPRALAEDPVRVLRAARLAAQPGWTLDVHVEPAARAVAPSLAGTAAERVRDELIGMLEEPDTGRALRLLDRMDVPAVVLPESAAMRATTQTPPHRFDVWEHSLRAVEAMDDIASHLDGLEPWGGDLAAHLIEPVGDGLTRGGAMKLAALLHDVSKPETRALVDGRTRFIGHDKLGAERARAIGRRLRLSTRATEIVARLVAHHLRPMHLAQAGLITRRARHRFFRDLGDEARDLVLVTLADAAAVRGDPPLAIWAGTAGDVLRLLIQGMNEEERIAAAPPLLTGHDVMGALGLGPGPEIGRHLARVRERQALGLLTTREEALAYLDRARPIA